VRHPGSLQRSRRTGSLYSLGGQFPSRALRSSRWRSHRESERRLGDKRLLPGGEGPADARSSVSRRGISSRSHARSCDRGFPLAAAIRRGPSANRQDSKCQPAAVHYRWNIAKDVSVPNRRRTLDATESVRGLSRSITRTHPLGCINAMSGIGTAGLGSAAFLPSFLLAPRQARFVFLG
jgi:hypothetical protein